MVIQTRGEGGGGGDASSVECMFSILNTPPALLSSEKFCELLEPPETRVQGRMLKFESQA
jgi:hypothetical protein